MNRTRMDLADKLSDIKKPTKANVDELDSLLIEAKREGADSIEISMIEDCLSTAYRAYQHSMMAKGNL